MSISKEFLCEHCNRWYTVTYERKPAEVALTLPPMCPRCGSNRVAATRDVELTDTSFRVTNTDTYPRPNGAPPILPNVPPADRVGPAKRAHAAWLGIADRLTRRWAHDVWAIYLDTEARALAKAERSGFAMVPDTTAVRAAALADVNGERAALGLPPITDEDI